MRLLILIYILLSTSTLLAQLPENLVASRSIVVMNLPLKESDNYLVRGDWAKDAETVQESLSLIGVDAISYLHSDDWDASPSSRETFQEYYKKRGVVHLLIFSKKDNGLFELEIKDFESLKTKWKTEGGSLNQVLFRLGKEIKRKNFTVENFLTIRDPEIVTDVPFSKWSASTSFPDQIKRLTIGVAQFDDENKNRKLKELLEPYPFKYELIEYVDDEDAFRKGYQYVLVNMGTAGESIKNLLNFKKGIGETDYISTVVADSTTTKLKTIPVDAFVYKFYFRQTVNHEVFVGRNWDADVSWELALENFILNLRIAFRKI